MKWVWNFAKVNEKTTDIFIYDNIAHKQSYDWWTGVKGDEVTAKTFMEELDNVSTPEICIHINSGGGDAFEAVAIAQAVRAARNNGKKISCCIDGICASAAVNVAISCSPIKIPRNAYMMIHDPVVFMYDYHSESELTNSANMLATVKRGMVEGYTEKTGLDENTIIDMMTKETWMTGSEAVNNGFADELLEYDIEIEQGEIKNLVQFGGVAASIANCRHIPINIKNAKKGREQMKIENKEQLRAAYPDIVNELECDARKEGQQSERERLQALDKVANTVSADVLNAAKYEKPIDVKDMLFEAATSGGLINQMGNAYLDAVKQDAQVVNQVSGFANGGLQISGKADETAQIASMAKSAFARK